jgi:hypothetical protein
MALFGSTPTRLLRNILGCAGVVRVVCVATRRVTQTSCTSEGLRVISHIE